MTSSATAGKPVHPGVHVREHIIPKGVTVTKAAALLGIGRPALSNFLNGKAALSQSMARRLERAFSADREALLDLQAQYDRRDEAIQTPIIAGRHAPVLAQILAGDIDRWAERIEARYEFPALLRRLVLTTGDGLTSVDFPAFDNAERPGFDGKVEAATPTPWIPEGKSVWEFGCDRRPGSKANGDYRKRVKKVPPEERRDTVFVFVTPRNWRGRDKWIEEKAALGDWKGVRAYDASDLEQWLEQSAPAQIWLAERLGKPVAGFRSLDRCWSDWAGPCELPLPPELFDPAVKEHAETFRQWLGKPPEQPFVVAADSREEALAFLCQLIRATASGTDEPDASAFAFDTPEALERFRVADVPPRVAVVHNDRVEREIGGLDQQCHCVIVRPGNDIGAEPDIRLGLLSSEAFSAALRSMGMTDGRIEALARESGRSPTVLRRRLSNKEAIRKPAWADGSGTERKLLPAALAAAWDEGHPADSEAVRLLAGKESYSDVEKDFAELLALEDSPVWSVRTNRGVVSRIDALYGIAGFVTKSDLEEFFTAAEWVLSETDPSLDLPENERWAAALHDKVRDHSAALRKGIRETLVLLAVHGNGLFRKRLGIDVEFRVSDLVRRLLTPLTIEKLLSHQGDLPDYAEAAPDAFLDSIEADLREPEPAVFGLLKPAGSAPFSPNPRTGVLWALECLGWQHLGRVSPILARMSEIPINDNLANKPMASLKGLYRWWLPQTAATLGERMQAIETLARRSPNIGWRVCMAQLEAGSQTAFPSYRPRWRGNTASRDNKKIPSDSFEFWQKTLDLALSWPKHDGETLGDLVEVLHGLPEEDQRQVWDLIDAWAESGPDDKAKAALRERIRRATLTRRGRRQGVTSEMLDRARAACGRLEPDNPIVRHARLFGNSWFDLIGEEDEEEEIDYKKHEEKVRKRRAAAMSEIWTQRGFEGVTALLSDCGAPDAVGGALAANIADEETRVGLLQQCLLTESIPQERSDICIRGFLWAVDDELRGDILARTAEGGDTGRIVRLYRCAPFRRQTWRLLDRYGGEVRDRYWAEVSAELGRFDEAELTELIDRLLNAKRPMAAFHAVRLDWSRLDTARLKRILDEMVNQNARSEDRYRPQGHNISDAIQELDRRSGIDRDEMAALEFKYIEALRRSDYGFPNLERRVSESPIDFVRILAFMFNRDDGKEDPPEWRIVDDRAKSTLFSVAFGLFTDMSRIPGTGEGGEIDPEKLSDWISETRRLCAEYGREYIGNQYIGQILSRGPAGEDGIRPCLPICEAMERTGSAEIGNGFRIGIYNGRGATWRAADGRGDQERELAAQYRSWAKRRSAEYPFVGKVLEDIAKSYDQEAQWHDENAEVENRIDY